MLFPCYNGIDMSAEDYGVWRIRLILEDGSCLAFSGHYDWGGLTMLDGNGNEMMVPLSWLKPDGPEAMAAAIEESNYEKVLALLKSGVDYPVTDPVWEWPYLWSLQYTADRPQDNELRLQIAEQLLKNGESPILMVEGETLLDFVCHTIFNDSPDHEQMEYLRKFIILLIAYGGRTSGNPPAKTFGGFRLSELKHHRNYYFGISPRADSWPDIHIFRLEDQWEVALA